MTPRVITLEGSFNFRDLGGYATSGGGTVRWRRLFRADGPHALTPADAALLRGVRITTVIDLRTGPEVERGRWTDHLGPVTEHHLPLTDVLPTDDQLPSWSEVTYVARHYGELLETGAPAIATALRVIAGAGRQSTMFHCSAGKDRTGVLSAVVLGLLGVADEDIAADYALSGEAMARMVEFLRARAEDPERIERHLPAILTASPRTMEHLLDHVREKYGSFDGYARAIGAGDTIEPLRATLLD